jgi:hypothetical protein
MSRQGHDKNAVAALQASFPAEFEFSAVAPPARNHDVGRLFARRQRDGRRAVQRWPHRLAVRLPEPGPLGVVVDMLTGKRSAFMESRKVT